MTTQPFVSILMGSKNDWPVMQNAKAILDEFGIACEARALSAHRTPDALEAYLKEAEDKGCFCFIAGAGGAAHLPGVVASKTQKPVLGVPISGKNLQGMDSLLAIVQMPKGIPVATFAIGEAGAGNAALFAVSLLALQDVSYQEKLTAFRKKQAQKVIENSKLA